MTKLEIANQALIFAGVSHTILNYETESDPTTTIVRSMFDGILQKNLTSYEWNFCKDYMSPPLENDTNIINGFTYAFQYNNAILKIRNAYKQKDISQPVKYESGFYNNKKVIFANQNPIMVCFTRDLTNNINNLPPYFKHLVSLNLAWNIAIPLVKNKVLISSLMQEYQTQMELSQSADSTEQSDFIHATQQSEYVTVRK